MEREDPHQVALSMVCRICGNFIKEKGYRTFLNSDKSVADSFRDLWSIDLSQEDKTVYPIGLCRAHIGLMRRYKQSETFETSIKPVSFEPHSSDCPICQEVETKQRPMHRSAFVKHKSKVKSSETFVKVTTDATVESQSPSSHTPSRTDRVRDKELHSLCDKILSLNDDDKTVFWNKLIQLQDRIRFNERDLHDVERCLVSIFDENRCNIFTLP